MSELIDELEERGYRVVEDDEFAPEDLIQEEIDFIVGTFSTYMPGTIGHSIYEKMRKR
jgi:branched-subunit amino acid aminotransferase/4-amino-4-deoxychorismate lyase